MSDPVLAERSACARDVRENEAEGWEGPRVTAWSDGYKVVSAHKAARKAIEEGVARG